MNDPFAKVFIVGVIVMLLLIFGMTSLASVPAGHAGIVVTFGQVNDTLLEPGLHVVAPWRKVHRLSLQTKEDKEKAQVPTKEGLSVDLEASLLYSLSKSRAIEVFKTVGTEYVEVLVKPQFRSALRGATTHYEAKDLYTANREKIEEDLARDVGTMLAGRGITCEAVLLRDVQLPKMVKDRIEAKLAADQDSQRMAFVLTKEKQEAERKRLEAQGIADAQMIIKKDLNHEYLVYLWIEALKETAKHNNATIYIPTGSDGMPFFKTIQGQNKVAREEAK